MSLALQKIFRWGYVRKCHSTTSGIAPSQDTHVYPSYARETGIETAVRRLTSTYGNVIVRVQSLLGLLGSKLLFVAQPRRIQLQERE